jgi:hypothetical protein
MVAGKWLMRHRQVQTIDTEKAMADFLQTARMFKINMAKLDIGT